MTTDNGSVFVSKLIHELLDVLGITLRHETPKHEEIIGVAEKTHVTIQTSLKMYSGEIRKQWYKYLPLAILNYNTTCHTSSGWEGSRIVNGRVFYNILDHKLGLKPKNGLGQTTDFADELLRRTHTLHDRSKNDVKQSYVIYKKNYDKKQKLSRYKKKTTPTHCNLKPITRDQKHPLATLNGLGLI